MNCRDRHAARTQPKKLGSARWPGQLLGRFSEAAKERPWARALAREQARACSWPPGANRFTCPARRCSISGSPSPLRCRLRGNDRGMTTLGFTLVYGMLLRKVHRLELVRRILLHDFALLRKIPPG